MKIQLSDHFTAGRLTRFVFPSIIMMVFTSIYGVVDGFFVSNFAGKAAFAAVNLIIPYIMILGTLGFMIGTGGTALVAKTLGEGDREKANSYFSMFVYSVVGFGAVFASISEIILPDVARLLGADEEMLPYCVTYGRIILISVTFFMLQNVFQSFLVAAEKPHLGLIITVFAGVSNMALDYLFVGVFKWGVVGAAAATVTAETIGGATPLIYFILPNKSILRLGRPSREIRAFFLACWNGISEFMTNISLSVVSIVYNYRLISFYGQNGVAAYGVIMYVNFVFISVFIGYSIGVAPIVGFNFGAGNKTELNNLLKKSLVFISCAGALMYTLSRIFAAPLSNLFAGYDSDLCELTRFAFSLFSISFFFSGFNIFSSSFFTALNNGTVSAVISLSRTLVFQLASVFILPLIFGKSAIWFSVSAAELFSLVLSAFLLIKMNGKYGYFPKREDKDHE